MNDYIADRRQYGTTGKCTGGGWLIMRWDEERQIFIEGTHYHQTKAGAREVLREEQQQAMAVSAAARTLGSKGGSVRSERKASASRANGRLGGRPRKSDPVADWADAEGEREAWAQVKRDNKRKSRE